MMNRKEFYEYVKDNVKEYLPKSYKDAEIKLQEVEKNNGLKLTGITIPNGDQRIVPTVYLDSLYQEYIHGKDVDSCVGDVADMRIEAQGKAEFFDMGVPDILDYEKMKDKLQMRICDKEWNTDLLADKVVTEHGDFAAYYAVNLEENGEGISSIPVTVSLMNEWGVSAEQIQADAMVADRKRGVTLMDMNEIIKSMIFGEEPENLLNEKMDMEAMENPMFCLTNKAKMNGASLLLQEDIRKQIGECLGSDYFVIPSSIHEVLILPDNGIFQVPELNAMVQEVNETKVERKITVKANPEWKEKIVYLTFDDGPSENTGKILDILKQYNIKGTFFVTGNHREHDDLIKRAFDEGNSIGLHTYTHDYATVYASEQAYFDDLQKVSDLVEKITGEKSTLIRFPGGSSNTVSADYVQGLMTTLTKAVHEKGYEYFDWNCDSTDASGNNVAVSKLVQNATLCSADHVTILMHDTDAKDTTVEALPQIIEYYRGQGYSFKGLTKDSVAAHHRVNN